MYKRQGLVLAGGMHATVAPDEMVAIPEFDHICQGPGEKIIVDLVTNPSAYPRLVHGESAKSMAEWPLIDRTLWPQPQGWRNKRRWHWKWPLEPACGWGPGPVATLITSRVCPWQCVFCNENSYIPNMGRKPVDQVIDELNFLDRQYGVGSVVIHDSMFFQNPTWLKEWIEKYPRKTKRWTYWAAGRADTVRQWPDLFEALMVARESHLQWIAEVLMYEAEATGLPICVFGRAFTPATKSLLIRKRSATLVSTTIGSCCGEKRCRTWKISPKASLCGNRKSVMTRSYLRDWIDSQPAARLSRIVSS